MGNSVSFWQKTSQAFTLQEELPATAEVVVIGGGILGSATAYFLARKGVPVVLVEQQFPAYGATGRNGGFVSLGPAESFLGARKRLGEEMAKRLFQFTMRNKELVRQVVEDEGIDCDYREPGNLALACSEESFEYQKTEVELLQGNGWPVELLDRQQVQGLIATPLAPMVQGAELLVNAGLVHSARLVQGLVAAAVRHGARACRATVRKVAQSGERVRVETNSGTITADGAVIALNAWTGEIVSAMTDYIMPVRGQVVAYEPIERVFEVGLSGDVGDRYAYWQQTVSGSIVIGGCRSVAKGFDEHITEQTPTAEVQQALDEILPTLFPQLTQLRASQRWAGLMAWTPDQVPLADRVPQTTNAWFAGGFNGQGMPFATHLGYVLADAVSEQRIDDTLALFRLARPTLQRF